MPTLTQANDALASIDARLTQVEDRMTALEVGIAELLALVRTLAKEAR